MSAAAPISTSVSALMGARVVDASGRTLGRVGELAVDVAHDGDHVAALVLRPVKAMRATLVPIASLAALEPDSGILRALAEPLPSQPLNDFLLLERDLLDQQIIDVDDRKVVRVNDVNLLWESSEATGQTAPLLRIAEVEVGLRGVSRRLLKGLPYPAVDAVADRFTARTIPWVAVDLIDRDPARRVRLKIGQDRLQTLHPSDIAAILEDLAPAEREAVFTNRPEETAAESLEELDPRTQKALLQGMDHERVADIIEEMDPAAAADLLNQLSEEESKAILGEMEPEERHEVEELREFSAHSAAGRMTTDYVDVASAALTENAIEALRAFEGDADTITEIYLTDNDGGLKGVVALPRLLMAKPGTPLARLSESHIVSCGLHASDAQVAELFDKYNLRSLPVLNPTGHIAGVIHAEQVIAQLREG